MILYILVKSSIPKTKAGKEKKTKKIMNEWKEGDLSIGRSDKKVPKTKKGQKQAVAIMLNQTGKSNKK